MTGIPTRDNAMAVFAGLTEDEAQTVLADIVALKTFKSPRIVRTTIVLAGTN